MMLLCVCLVSRTVTYTICYILLVVLIILTYCRLLVPAMEFGSVICEGVQLGDIPIELQEANVFKLRLKNNGMHSLPDNRLAGTGMSIYMTFLKVTFLYF